MIPSFRPFPLLFPCALLLRAAAAAQEPTPQAPAAPTPPPLPAAALAVQADFVALTKQVFPSIVTVRTFVRGDAPQAADATTDAPAASAPAAGAPAAGAQAAGWVLAQSSERDYPGFRPHRSASGFFVSADGEVLTSLDALRVDGDRLAEVVEVETMDQHRVLCEVLGIEPTLQLAVLRCAVFPSWAKPEMRPLPFGDSEAAEIGSWVVGVGDPIGPERFLGLGLLVAKPSRDCYQELMSATYMQSTLPVPAGALGGPLVSLDGKVLGILSRLQVEGVGEVGSTGSSWALPSKILRGLYESIRTAGTTQSPWLGFSVISRNEIAIARGLLAFQKMAKPPHGIVLENVFAPSPAAVAGLQPDDFLTHFDGVEIHAPVDFQRQLYLSGVGRVVELKFFRAGETFAKALTIEKRPEAAKPR